MQHSLSPSGPFHAELTEEVYQRGEFIYLPGDPSEAVYLIQAGRVRLAFCDELGERQTVAILGPGELFGELVLSGEAPQEFSAQALTETRLYVLDKWRLLELIRSAPGSELSDRLRQLLGYKKELLFLYQR
ncbi:MAG: cyclic nucleotide-binding domain-containing protein [Candidatus Bipolaricaulia bacterium]